MQLVVIRFLRDRRVVDVDPPLGAAVLDARDLPREQSAGRCTAGQQPLPDRAEGIRWEKELESLGREIRNARDHHRAPADLGVDVRVRCERGERLARDAGGGA